MRGDAEAVIAGLYAAGRIEDTAAILAYCHDDIRFVINQPNGVTGLGGHIVGKTALRRYLRAVFERWQVVEFSHGILRIEDGLVRETGRFHVLHRPTGLPLEGRKRHVWHVVDGRIARCEEYQDASQIAAFLRMAETR